MTEDKCSTEIFDRLMVVMNERDRRYEERFTEQKHAVASALAASEKAISVALLAQKDAAAVAAVTTNVAVAKAEQVQAAGFAQLRELIDQQTERINVLQLGERRIAGGADATRELKQQSNWSTSFIVGTIIGLAGLLAGILMFILGRS